MQIAVLTIFPSLFEPFFAESLIGKGVVSGQLEHIVINIRDHTLDKHKKVDDIPYGGGPGMVMTPQPLHESILAAQAHFGSKGHVVFTSPQGAPFSHATAMRFSQLDKPLIILCGRYEGIDERIRQNFVDEEVSLGDFVLNGGELAAMTIIEAATRLIPGMMGNAESLTEESHTHGLLEYPQYTRPANFMGYEIPPVLVSGHHARIMDWRRAESLKRTRSRRPDLFEKYPLSEHERALLEREED